MKTEELQKQGNIDLEPFYQALEDDSKLLEEALVRYYWKWFTLNLNQ